MKNAKRRKSIAATTAKRLPLKPAMVSAITACSIGALLGSPAFAVELGPIRLESALGQPLRASISYALAPNEQINEQCVYLRSGLPSSDVPEITRATVTLSGQQILVRGNTPLREPMMNLQLAIDCPYTARLQRDYVLLLNPPSFAESSRAAANATPGRGVGAAAMPTTRPAEPLRAARVARDAVPAPVTGQSYRVRPGDTLSGIVSRIENRQARLWDAVDAIHAANPGAFLNNNVDRLLAGSTLIIPASITDGTSASTVTATAIESPAPAPVATDKAYPGVGASAAVADTSSEAVSDKQPSAQIEPGVVPEIVTETDAQANGSMPAETTRASTASGNLPEATQAELPVVTTPASRTANAPDTRVVQQQSVPVPVSDIGQNRPTQFWLAWLGGAGVAIFLGLVVFGRRLRERFGDNPDLDATQLAETTLNRRSTDRGESAPDHDIGLDDVVTPVTSEYRLDADLTDGAGFDNDDIDVALDYNFASSGDFSDDLDLIVSADAEHDADAPTAIMPSRESAQAASESADTSYDMSMVVDVSKQNFESSATTRDLQAIQVELLKQGALNVGPLDLTTEFDQRILEQDYEAEMTATQVLNNEIEQAARELQERLVEFNTDENAVSMAEDLEGTAEVTAEMPARSPARNDNLDSESGDSLQGHSVEFNTDANAISMAEDLEGTAEVTAEMPVRSPARNDNLDDESGDSLTARMPGSIDDSFDIDVDMETAVHERKSKAG